MPDTAHITDSELAVLKEMADRTPNFWSAVIGNDKMLALLARLEAAERETKHLQGLIVAEHTEPPCCPCDDQTIALAIQLAECERARDSAYAEIERLKAAVATLQKNGAGTSK
jgi:hypothetical protein